MANSIKKYTWSDTHDTNSQFLAPTALSGRESTDIKVKVGKAELTNSQYQLVTSGNSRYAKFNQGFTPNLGDPIRIYRETNHTARLVDFVDGSLLTSETLDLDSNQLFNIAQEAYDKGDEATIGSESFYYTQGDAPTNVAVGTLWYDTGSSTNTLQVWSGTEWQQTAPAKVKKTYQRVTTNGFTQVANNAHSNGKTKFADTAFKTHSSLYLNGVKLVEASTLANIPSKGDYFLSGGDVILLNLSSDTDVLVSETFDGSFSSSVTASETNAAASADAAEESATTAGQWAGEAINNYAASNDEKLDAAKYASHPKNSSFSTHDNSATNQYSAKHYAELSADNNNAAQSAATNANVQAVGYDLVLGNNSKIKKVSDDITAVGDVAGIINDVTSVSNLGNELDTIVNKYDGTTNASGTNKNIVQVDTVADNIGDVNTVAADTSKIDTIASDLDNGASSFIKKVSDGMVSVAAVASLVGTALANGITWLANTTNQNTLGAVEGKIAEIDAVEAKLTQIDTVAGVADEVAVVGESGYKGNVQTVANTDYKAKVTTVASMQDDVNTVASASSDIDTITTGDNLTSVVTVATDLNGSNNIGTVAGIPTQVETVAGIAAEVVTVHGNNADISTVATSLNAGNSIDNVSGGITNVETVAGVISEVQTVAGVSDEVRNLSASTGNMATLVSKLDQTNDLAGAVTDAQNSATSASSSASTATTQATAAAGSASTAATHAANLGSVAYQDLTAIAESKSVSAVDVFVYDTSKDSDGGAWRNRTQGTSWYNEALNTSSRGATKKFPAVAVIVMEARKLTIYDADDPSMPLWMVFNAGGTNDTQAMLQRDTNDVTCVTALNGTIVVGGLNQNNHSGGVRQINFPKDNSFAHYTTSIYNGYFKGNIQQRNSLLGVTPQDSGQIVERNVNDVAVTVLPNAPIDADTGLPVPTIAVATDGGVSVIKDDGSVVSKSSNLSNYNHNICDNIVFYGEDILFNVWNNSAYHSVARWDYELTTLKSVYSTYSNLVPSDTVIKLPSGIAGNGASGRGVVTSGDNTSLAYGAFVVNVNETTGKPKESLVNVINSSYNTGWMNGDTKLATLMDTTAETISAPELVTNGDFSNGTTGWNVGANAIVSINSSGQMVIDRNSEDSHHTVYQELTTEVGKTYNIGFDLIDDGVHSNFKVAVRASSSSGNLVLHQDVHNANGTKIPQLLSFTATSTSSWLSLAPTGTATNTGIIDNISVVEAVADRSVNNNGLNIVGNVTKSAVATGAELVSYDLGGASAYLSKSNFDFPDYDCSVMFWVGDSGSDRNVLFLGDSTNYNPANGVNIWVFNGRVKSYWGGQYVYGVHGELDGGRHFVCYVRKGDTVSLYVDGKYVSKNGVPITNAISDTDLAIGKGYYANGQGCTDLALLRISATAPTAEQIAKIYRDEKPLFQEGAKCTLYGTIDSVNAIAYDEDTELLHAGTSGGASQTKGRSMFKGLQRVDVSTDQVTTAISAANGLVVEE